MPEVKFGNTYIQINGETVAKVTTFSRSAEISEEDITGSEDVVAGSNVLHQKFASIAVGETAEMEGITIESQTTGLDDGQSELRDSAEKGETVTVRYARHTGFGYALSGFFTAYEESGSTSEVYKWKGSFRINEKTEITPGS